MELSKATDLASRFVDLIDPYCERVMVVGSIRRKRPQINDIDVVALPRRDKRLSRTWFGDHWEYVNSLTEGVSSYLKKGVLKPRVMKDGKTMMGEGVLFLQFMDFPVDLYICPSKERWWGLVLIRTGSVEFNRFLIHRAMDRGLILHADGRGLCDRKTGERLDRGINEVDIFSLLGLRYYKPEEREIP